LIEACVSWIAQRPAALPADTFSVVDNIAPRPPQMLTAAPRIPDAHLAPASAARYDP
jgi:hypothetical protein